MKSHRPGNSKKTHEKISQLRDANKRYKTENGIADSRLNLLPYGAMRFAGGWRAETWVLKVDRVICSPDSAPTVPDGTEIRLVLFARNHHVKSVAVLVGGVTWWSSWES